MTRRLLAVLAITVAVAGPLASSASAADCGPLLDSVGHALPYPASTVYWRVCGA